MRYNFIHNNIISNHQSSSLLTVSVSIFVPSVGDILARLPIQIYAISILSDYLESTFCSHIEISLCILVGPDFCDFEIVDLYHTKEKKLMPATHTCGTETQFFGSTTPSPPYS